MVVVMPNSQLAVRTKWNESLGVGLSSANVPIRGTHMEWEWLLLRGHPNPCLFAAKWGRGDSFMAGGGWQQLKSPFSIITEPDSHSILGAAHWGCRQHGPGVHSQPNPRASHSPDVGEAQVRLSKQPEVGTAAS